MSKTPAVEREETMDYYDQAVLDMEAEATKPFGRMEQKHAKVLLRGLQTQNINDLLKIKEDFPEIWDKYKQQSKTKKWIFDREVYKQLVAFATGEPVQAQVAEL